MGRLRLLGERQPNGGGVSDHAALSNLAYAQSGHSGFVPSQGEALIDILRLNQNLIRDSDGNDRLQLATTSPHITLLGDLAASYLSITATRDTHPATGLQADVTGNRSSGGGQFTYGIAGMALGAGTPNYAVVYGLYFSAKHATPSPCLQLGGIAIQQQSTPEGTGPLGIARGLSVPVSYWGGRHPLTSIGLDIEDQGGASVVTAYGVRVYDQTAAIVRLLELGPTTPYLRLLGGGDPPADKSNLYLKFGSTLYRVVKTGNYMSLEAA